MLYGMATETQSKTWWRGYAGVEEGLSMEGPKRSLELSLSYPQDVNLQRSAPTQSSSKQGPRYPSKTLAIPSIADIKPHLRVLPNTSLFYSRIAVGAPSYKPVAKAWRDDNNPGLYVLEESWDTAQSWTKFYGHTGSASVLEKGIFWARACKALAELASGRVFVVLGPDIIAPDWGDSDTAWAKYEWPALQANSAVKEVIQVNPYTGSKTVILAR
jgi:hypothetical protein